MAFSQELLDCSICYETLEDPVTTSCGHSYCIRCINTYWDSNNNGGRGYSCPQCRQIFSPRPDLRRNTLLNNLLEEHKRVARQKAEAEAAAAAAAAEDEDEEVSMDDDTYATPGDVQCDACTGRKRKAHMFCLVCLTYFCENHLKPHLEVPPLKKHKLTQASAGIRESICGRHDKLMEIYCRTDQQFLCLLCAMYEHKGHDAVAVAAEKCEMQRQLDWTRQEIADRVLNSERKMEELKKAADSIRDTAWEVCDDFEQLSEEHIRFVKRKCSEMREKAGEVEKTGVDWISRHVGQLGREVLELRRRGDKLEQLSKIQDPIQFIKGYQALGDLPVFAAVHQRVNTMTEFVTAQKDQLKNICDKEKNELLSDSQKNVLSMNLVRPALHEEITTRKFLLSKSQNSNLEVDPNTVAACLSLSDNNREISWSGSDQAHPPHPDRFSYSHQALCKNGLEGQHYWEVEWDVGIVDLAVSYKGIQRNGLGKDCCFGHNDLSWKLTCAPSACTFWHNKLHKGRIPPARFRRVGMHLDREAGTLAFYSVSEPDRLTLLHRVHTTFTEPLYPGFSIDLGSTLKICKI